MLNGQIFETPLPRLDRRREKIARASHHRQTELNAAMPWTLPPEIYECSCADLIEKVEPGSVNLILTDPPYPKEFLPTWSELGRLAEHALCEGGMLFAMTGCVNMDKSHERISSAAPMLKWHPPMHIDLVNKSIFPPGHNCVFAGAHMKLYLVYAKGKPTYHKKFGTNLIRGLQREKALHPWQQSLSIVAPVVERICLPGKVVVDPFLGSGTTAVAAMQRGCRFIGCDIDPDALNTAKERVKQARGAA